MFLLKFMIQNPQNGINLTLFKDLDILAGPQATMFMFMVVLSTKFQIYLLKKYVKLILKSYFKDMKIYCRKLNLQKKLEKKMIKIKKKQLKKINKVYTIWIDNLNLQIKLILPLNIISQIKPVKHKQKIFH